MIADVAFDAPVRHSFSYRVPDGWTLAPGQRARAPLRGAARVGMVVALRDGTDPQLKPLARLVDPEPVLSTAQLEQPLLTAGADQELGLGRGERARAAGGCWDSAGVRAPRRRQERGAGRPH